MGKNKGGRSDAEKSRVQEISYENKKLKRELSSLRKQLSRIETGWCPGCLKNDSKNIPEDHDLPPVSQPVKNKDWTCHKCEKGSLFLIKYMKVEEAWYFRKCDSCNNRTIGKKYTDDVKSS